jgi:hypothetical protein
MNAELTQLENDFDLRVNDVETLTKAFDDLMYSGADDWDKAKKQVHGLSHILVRHVGAMVKAREAIDDFHGRQREIIRVAGEEAVKADRLRAAKVARKRKVRR